MKRKAIMALLLTGTALGWGFGALRIAHYRHYVGHGPSRMFERRAAFERHVADVCVDAALRARVPATSN
ncbi:MAG TPA: hypothetical protein PKA88_05165 [Polyangiaceae bacterium]|nr:hypothetical protein [Polyangiaceae bacterium]HMR74253.1 hypothetical protein [Polyangiaceae bacterium]